jgi:hypothetical protein
MYFISLAQNTGNKSEVNTEDGANISVKMQMF